MKFSCSNLCVALALLVGVGGAMEVLASGSSADAGGQSAGVELCVDMGPQTPRDIASGVGLNTEAFPLAPAVNELNLCNIHTHTNAEHKGPGFSLFVSRADDGGYACNGTPELSEAERAPAPGAYQGVEPGDTIEVHWVHTSCDTTPGEGLGACVPGRLQRSPVARGSPGIPGRQRSGRAGLHRDGVWREHRRWPAPGEGHSVDDGRARTVPRFNDRAVIRPAQVFGRQGDVERASAVREARHQLAAPLGGAGERVQRNRVARRPAVGHRPGAALAHRLIRPLLVEGGALDQCVDTLADGQPQVVGGSAGDARPQVLIADLDQGLGKG